MDFPFLFFLKKKIVFMTVEQSEVFVKNSKTKLHFGFRSVVSKLLTD